ncbi:hypothetical protein [Arcanobacterium buesumense]|uniref:TrbL/VirB6 plasmid conjugal transfer protein n=1 Tax=Arcanobacterium buesumense TaxID=2722751 RepID=A0A6H2EN61_9ACTO|nr:hypothetical protein [Arcanobacterium buesumense]QJC22513.1 hypothetical protein HC352_08360 [Arcanobacterium buesumense]
MEEYIKKMLEDILGNGFFNQTDGLYDSVAGYSASAYQVALTVNSTVVKPVAASVVAIILVLELARVSTKFEGDSKMGVQVIGTIMIKAALLIVAIQNVDLILKAINEAGETLINGLKKHATVIQSNPVNIGDLDMDTLDMIGAMIILFLPWLISMIGGVVVKIVVLLRFAEIYILSAGATLPLAFLGHTETKQISIGYLKKYATAMLHGFTIILVLIIFAKFQGAGTDLGENPTVDDVMANFVNLVAVPIGFIFLVLSSGKFAKALVGEA